MTARYLQLWLWILVTQLRAAEFRFQQYDGVTGLASVVWTGNQRPTHIIFTDDSDAEALAVLDALLDKDISGRKGIEYRDGVKWEQGIILVGKFVSQTKRTEGPAYTVSGEKYRDFRLTNIKVLFPLARFVEVEGMNSIDPPMFMETHFDFSSLFPHGINLKGTPIDLSKHVAKRGRSK